MSYANQRLDVNPGVMVLRVVGGAWICRHGLVLSTCDAMRQQCAHSKMLLNYCYLNYCYCCDAATARTLQDGVQALDQGHSSLGSRRTELHGQEARCAGIHSCAARHAPPGSCPGPQV